MTPKRWWPWAAAGFLFALNAYICLELFTTPFVGNLSSNDGAFIAFSRFYRDHFRDLNWFPWFNAGMPIENAYQPLLPALGALSSAVSGWPIARAFHSVLAMVYCLGPLTLFLFAWEWSGSIVASLGAGLAYSLLSPGEMAIPVLRVLDNGHWVPLRLYNLVHYAEDPHNLALTLLPLALYCLRRGKWAAAVVSCAVVVMSNAFGAVDLVIGGLCIVLATGGGFQRLAGVGLLAYVWVSPWLPPSLIQLIGKDQWGARGLFQSGPKAWLGIAVTVGLFGGIWWATRRLGPSLERFSLLFVFPMVLIPAGFFLGGLTLVPQANRYQLELEMAVCLVLGCLAARVPRRLAVAGLVLVILGGVWQAKVFRHAARGMLQPVEITGTIQYKTCAAVDRLLPGKRVMVSGDTEFICNIFWDTPQLSSGHAPSAPNFMQQVAVYQTYVGGESARQATEVSMLWLKAFGAQAITVPGEKSREFYHPLVFPHRYDGVLPVLWRDEDDTIFGIPQRSPSLARVVPQTALVGRTPIHGLDVEPLRPFVQALEDPGMPLADLVWESQSKARIRASMSGTQALSIAMNWAPGWRAEVSGKPAEVRKDGIGLIALVPGCNGPCEVELEYGASTEAWICRVLSGLATLALAAHGIFAVVRRGSRLQPSPR